MKHTLLIIMVLLSSLIFSQQREEIIERYSNGVKKSIVVYKGQGSKERLVKKLEYYENEKIKSSTDWKDGKPNGDFIEWYDNGQKKFEGTFMDGEEVGKWTYWSPDGKESSELIYKDGKAWDGVGMWVSYNDWIKHGVMGTVESYKNGKRDGMWIEYTGKEKRSGNYKNGKRDGLRTDWYENGQKQKEATYKDGEYDGLQTEWYENGQKESETTYKDGKQIEITYYDRDGNEY